MTTTAASPSVTRGSFAARLGAQVWMTGADPAAFAEIASRADAFEVTPGHAARRL